MNPQQEKFLLFTLEYPPFKGGISQYYKNLAEYWPTDQFFILTDNSLLNKDTKKIKYRQLLNKYLRPRWVRAIWQLHKAISNLSFDKLRTSKSPISPSTSSGQANFHVIVGHILPLGQAAYYLAKFKKFKYSVILHGLDFSLAIKTKPKQKITKKILKRAEKIVCANNYTAALVKCFDINLAPKVFVVSPSIEPSFVRNPQRVKELREKYGLAGKTVMLGLGRLVQRKGIDKVIEALAIAERQAPTIVYAVAGTGPEEKNLKNLAASLPDGLKNKIIFLGQISDADRWAWLELCDIFIMASRNISGDFEGFGTVYLEANLAGVPVIAGDSGGVRDAVINNINGLMVDSEKPEDIARAIIKLAADAKLRQELGEQGKRRTVENFNAKKQAEKIYKLLIG
jgi:phosphatidyl-myo-inositol dimannoside synthase